MLEANKKVTPYLDQETPCQAGIERNQHSFGGEMLVLSIVALDEYSEKVGYGKLYGTYSPTGRESTAYSPISLV